MFLCYTPLMKQIAIKPMSPYVVTHYRDEGKTKSVARTEAEVQQFL